MKKPSDQAKPRVGIYARLSKDRQKLSINTAIQVQECREFADDEGLQVVAEFQETDISASKYSKKPRPDYRRLVEMIRNNELDGILATEQERLHRRPDEMSELIDLAQTTDLKYVYFSNDDSFNLRDADGIWRARGAVANAERESNKTSKRQKRKKLAQAKQGLPTGGRRPYGYEPDMITIRESEAEVYREMARRVIGGQSCKTVAYWLNETGHQTTTGKLFYPVTVRNLLIKPRYMGIREHLGVHYPAVWKGIIDAATFERVQDRMRASADKFGRPERAVRYLLTKKAVCGRCGGSITGRRRRDRKDGPLRETYYCKLNGDTSRRDGCGLRRNAPALNAFVRDAIIFRLDTPDLGKLLAKSPEDDRKLRMLLADRDAQTALKKRLAVQLGKGLLDDEDYAEARQAVVHEIERINDEIARLTRSTQAVDIIAPGQTVREAWDTKGVEWQRALVDLLVERVIIHPSSGLPPLVMVDGTRMRFRPSDNQIVWRDDYEA